MKYKTLILSLFLVCIQSGIAAQPMQLKFYQFDSLIRQSIPEGFSDIQLIRQQGNEFEAFLSNNSNTILMIKASPSVYFEAYESTDSIFFIEEFKAIYIETELLSSLHIYHQKLYTTISFSVNKPGEKALLSAIAQESKLLQLLPPPYIWPLCIDAEDRIEGEIISIKKRDTAPDGYLEVIEVKVICSEKLYQSINSIMKQNTYNEHYITLKHAILIPVSCSIKELESCMNEQSTIQLNYFISNK